MGVISFLYGPIRSQRQAHLIRKVTAGLVIVLSIAAPLIMLIFGAVEDAVMGLLFGALHIGLAVTMLRTRSVIPVATLLALVCIDLIPLFLLMVIAVFSFALLAKGAPPGLEMLLLPAGFLGFLLIWFFPYALYRSIRATSFLRREDAAAQPPPQAAPSTPA